MKLVNAEFPEKGISDNALAARSVFANEEATVGLFATVVSTIGAVMFKKKNNN